MTLIPGPEPYAIAVKRIQRKAQAFGTSALELMLIITFLILLMLLTYFSSIVPAVNAARNEELEELTREELVGFASDLRRQLETALAENRELRAQNEELTEIVNDSMEELAAADSQEDARPNRLPERTANLRRQLETALAENKEVRAQNEELTERLKELERGESSGEHDWPPSIPLDEADGYSFQSNSSEVSARFKDLLQQKIVPRILEVSAQYKANVIEVVGHTDERPVSGMSTLDENLLPFLRGNPDAPLTAADNAGLGFARAAAVVRVLAESSKLSSHYLTPLSGAQVILRNGAIADGLESGDRPRRRRIEIRMRGNDAPAPPIVDIPATWDYEREITGRVVVTDGDTLVVAGEKVRLDAVDAPESKQTCKAANGSRYACGSLAAQALGERIGADPVRCGYEERDRYGRILAICHAADGSDLNAWLVEQGYAIAYRYYSMRYAAHEDRAKAAGRGIWAGEFMEPYRWRRGQRLR